MELKLTTKNLELKPSSLQQIENKLSKLGRHLPDAGETRVEIAEEKTRSDRDRFVAQVTIETGSVTLRSEERADTPLNAIDKVAAILDRQIKRYKSKNKTSGKNNGIARAIKIGKLPTATPPKVKIKKFGIKPMPLKDAIEQMELLGHDFFIYLSHEDNSLRLLYRRHGGGYGVIEPHIDIY
jgi:putative sigma-54 modulation protein